MIGHSVPAYKLAVFVIAALYAGLAGGLLGVFQSYMPPDAFSLDTSGQLVVQTVIGGVGTLIGPLLGAAIWLWLRDNLQQMPHVGALWKLILGLIFVAAGGGAAAAASPARSAAPSPAGAWPPRKPACRRRPGDAAVMPPAAPAAAADCAAGRRAAPARRRCARSASAKHLRRPARGGGRLVRGAAPDRSTR